MKIWIDFINSPQVSFFEPLIDDLTKSGHEVVLTCRDSANTVDLIKQRNWKHTIIGRQVKKSTLSKMLAFSGRIYSLYSFLRLKKIDVAICQSSFYLPLTAKLLGIPSIYTNDNEHAMGNIPSFLFATKVLIPENLSIKKVLKKGARRSRLSKYPGIKEGVYLWKKGVEIQSKRQNKSVDHRQIFVRPEPQTAQYYTGKVNFLDNLLLELKEHYVVTVLTRERSQLEHYRQEQFDGIQVPEHPLPFDEIAANCSLFIGAGGSMTREMALMGIPTISVYQGELLDVDKFLIAEKQMMHRLDLTSGDVINVLSSQTSRDVNVTLIEKGREAYELFKQEILKYSKNG